MRSQWWPLEKLQAQIKDTCWQELGNFARRKTFYISLPKTKRATLITAITHQWHLLPIHQPQVFRSTWILPMSQSKQTKVLETGVILGSSWISTNVQYLSNLPLYWWCHLYSVASSGGISFVDVGLVQQIYYLGQGYDNSNNCGAFPEVVSMYPDGKFTTPARAHCWPSCFQPHHQKANISWSTGRTADSKSPMAPVLALTLTKKLPTRIKWPVTLSTWPISLLGRPIISWLNGLTRMKHWRFRRTNFRHLPSQAPSQ